MDFFFHKKETAFLRQPLFYEVNLRFHSHITLLRSIIAQQNHKAFFITQCLSI